tara:strand:+ start:172 stop:540 length:369 start_codon:yes stop_codon:yes gene_type:complete
MTKTVNFMGEELNVKLSKYANGQNAMQLVDQDGMPFMTASVAYDSGVLDEIYNIKLEKDSVIIKNYSENEGILEALIEAEIIDCEVLPFKVNYVTLLVAVLITDDIDPDIDPAGGYGLASHV